MGLFLNREIERREWFKEILVLFSFSFPFFWWDENFTLKKYTLFNDKEESSLTVQLLLQLVQVSKCLAWSKGLMVEGEPLDIVVLRSRTLAGQWPKRLSSGAIKEATKTDPGT